MTSPLPSVPQNGLLPAFRSTFLSWERRDSINNRTITAVQEINPDISVETEYQGISRWSHFFHLLFPPVFEVRTSISFRVCTFPVTSHKQLSASSAAFPTRNTGLPLAKSQIEIPKAAPDCPSHPSPAQLFFLEVLSKSSFPSRYFCVHPTVERRRSVVPKKPKQDPSQQSAPSSNSKRIAHWEP